MQMQPIVDRLQAEYEDQVGFVQANAEDGGAGQAAFRGPNLPGHPSIVILLADGAEVFRAFGILEEDALRAALNAALEAEVSPTP